MLDDIKMIHERDSHDVLGKFEKQWQQYIHVLPFAWTPPVVVTKIVIAAMGNSALAASIMSSWPSLSVPCHVVQDYDLPAYVDASTLVICLSYTGDTEEVVSICERALTSPQAQRPMIVVVTSSGQLRELARQHDLATLYLPGGEVSRMTFGLQLQALAIVCEGTHHLKGASVELAFAGQWLASQLTLWLPTIPTAKNYAKQLALELIGQSVVLYAGPKLYPAAYKWKLDLNQNAKQLAWAGCYPEFNHAEMISWTKQPMQKPYKVVELRSSLEHQRTLQRFAITERLLSGLRPSPLIVAPHGDTLLYQQLWAMLLGDFVSVYIALLSGINPMPQKLMETFNQEMEHSL